MCENCSADVNDNPNLNEAYIAPVVKRFEKEIKDTFEVDATNYCEPRVMTVNHEAFYANYIRRVDPKAEIAFLVEERKLQVGVDEVKLLEENSPGFIYAKFSYEGFPFLVVTTRWGESYAKLLFYNPKAPVVKLVQQIRKWNRSAPTVHIYDNGNEYKLSEIKKLPFVVPGSVMAAWKQYIHPQLTMEQTWNHVVFSGPPGCGKTAFTRWVATQYPTWKFIFVGPSSVTKPGHVSQIFDYARRRVPAVLIFEDIDLIGKHRLEMSQQFDPLLGELLNNLDGVEPNNKLLAIASTNNLPALDPAVTRPGRLGIHMPMSYTDNEKLQVLLNYYDFPRIAVKEVLTPYVKDVDSPARLKMIAKLSMIFEQFEHHNLTFSKFAEIVKTIVDERQIPTVIEDDDDDTDTEDAKGKSSPPPHPTESKPYVR